jgi:hypothetical protein
VIVKVDVLRYPAPLNHLANINPRVHARRSVFYDLIPDCSLGLDRFAITEQTDVDFFMNALSREKNWIGLLKLSLLKFGN